LTPALFRDIILLTKGKSLNAITRRCIVIISQRVPFVNTKTQNRKEAEGSEFRNNDNFAAWQPSGEHVYLSEGADVGCGKFGQPGQRALSFMESEFRKINISFAKFVDGGGDYREQSRLVLRNCERFILALTADTRAPA
jgi:hypothetical protein